jgi:bifunctional pyridoxal-dependent enzyme with beta-cystathionase and maltose regulon repressor activities
VEPVLGNCSLAELARRKSFKWRTYPPDVLSAFVAEMDFTVAEEISETVRAALAIGDTGYPHADGLGEAFASFAAGRLGWRPRSDWVFAVPDATTWISRLSTRHWRDRTSVPIWVRAVRIDRPRDDRARVHLQLGVQGLEYRGPEMRDRRRGIGWWRGRAGRAMGSAALLLPWPARVGGRIHPVAALGFARLSNDENRKLLATLLREQLPGVGYVPGSATFLAWLDCRNLGLGDDPAAAFLERGRVALSPGADFGLQGAGFARLNIGTSPELINEAVRRMAVAAP